LPKVGVTVNTKELERLALSLGQFFFLHVTKVKKKKRGAIKFINDQPKVCIFL
jgi:hypothetical protein